MEKGSPKLNSSLIRTSTKGVGAGMYSNYPPSPKIKGMRSVQQMPSPAKRIQEMRSQNSGVINSISANASTKMNSKLHSIIDKKTIGTASMRQRPNQQGGISQFGINQSATLQNMRPFLSPDSTQFAGPQLNNQNANQSIQFQQSPQQSTTNANSLSFLVKPSFSLGCNQSGSQNNRMMNNSCMTIPTYNLLNSITHENQGSMNNIIETSQINYHNKQQSFGSNSNLNPSNPNQHQQQLNTISFKNTFYKQPNTPQVNSSSNAANQEKRLSEQLNRENSFKFVQFGQQQGIQETQISHSPQLTLMQALTQKSALPTQGSNRANQKARKTNSMSMIRLRQSQDSFFDTILSGESHSNQGRSMVQAKKKKKTKKFGLGAGISPNSTSSTAAAAVLSQLIQSQTTRMKNIPSPQPSYSHLHNKTTDSFKAQQTSSSSQNEFSPQFFSKLKKKKLLLFQSNSRLNQSNKQENNQPVTIQSQQYQQEKQQKDLLSQVSQNYHQNSQSSLENTPNYQLWLIQQQQAKQLQQNQLLTISSPTLKNTASTLSQMSQQTGYQQSMQQFNGQGSNLIQSQSLESNQDSYILKKSSSGNTSKTHCLLDKLNKLHKFSQQNLQTNQIYSPPFSAYTETVTPNQQQQNIQIGTSQVNRTTEKNSSQNHLRMPTQEDQNNKYQKDIFKRFKELITDTKTNKNNNNNNTTTSNNNTINQNELSPLIMNSQKQKLIQSSNDNVVENENNKSFILTHQMIQSAQKIQDIPLPSQSLKTHQYEEYENILEGYKNSREESDGNLKEFMDYLINFAKKFVKPIPQIVKNAQQISSQYKKKDEEVNKLKQEKLCLIMERNKNNQQSHLLQSEKQSIPEYYSYIQNSSAQQQQMQTLKELHTPSTRVEESSQQVVILDYESQVKKLKQQLEEKNNQLGILMERENITITYLQQLQKLGYFPVQSAFASEQSLRNTKCDVNITKFNDKITDSSYHNTPHSTNPLESSCTRNSNQFSVSQKNQIQQSGEKEFLFNSANLISLPSNDNDREAFLNSNQFIQSKLQKINLPQISKLENFLSEQSISERLNKDKQPIQQSQEINQQFNQWIKFISHKKKNPHVHKSNFNQGNQGNNVNSLVQSFNGLNNNSSSNNNNNLNDNSVNANSAAFQNNYLNPDFSMNLDHSSQHTNICNSMSDRNSKNKQNEKEQPKSDLTSDNNMVELNPVVKLIEKTSHLKTINPSIANNGISSENTPHSQIDTALQNKSTQGNINQISSSTNDMDVNSLQYLKNTPLVSGQVAGDGSSKIQIEDYKKKNSKLSSVCSSARNSFTSKSSYLDEDMNNIDIHNQISIAQHELQSRYNQSMIIKSKSQNNLNDNIRQKLRLDLSVLKSPQSSNQLNNGASSTLAGGTQGFQLNLGKLNQDHPEQNNANQNQHQVMDYYDEFMSKIDEFSLSWRKAVIDESQKYQNRDNPFKKQQLMDQYQKQISSNANQNQEIKKE